MRIYKYIAVGLLLPAVGCQKSTPPEPEAVQADVVQAKDPDPDPKKVLASLDPRVVQASELAANIAREPENSDQILAQKNLDREGLDALMYEIALDPELSSQYRIARAIQ